jgi:p-aminobenzoyl-glutamate transporter AbgT
MTCPQCHEAIPASSLWTSSGLSNVVCERCGTHLKPKPLSAILVFVLSFGLAEAAMLVLRRVGAVYWMTFVGFFVVFAVVFALGSPALLRFQTKERKENPAASGTMH